MKSRPTPRWGHCGVAAALVVSVTGLTGCSSADPSAAAIVDGTVIKDADLWAVVHDLAKIPRNAEVGATDVLPVLIQAEVVQKHAAELNAPTIGADTIRTQLRALVPPGQPEPDWSDATIKTFQDAALLAPVLRGQSQKKAIELIQKADITVNPRYGAFDRKELTLVPATPNWMVPTPEPTAPAQPQAPAPQPGGNPSTLPGGPSGSTPSAPTSGASAPTGGASTPASTSQPSAPAPTTSK